MREWGEAGHADLRSTPERNRAILQAFAAFVRFSRTTDYPFGQYVADLDRMPSPRLRWRERAKNAWRFNAGIATVQEMRDASYPSRARKRLLLWWAAYHPQAGELPELSRSLDWQRRHPTLAKRLGWEPTAEPSGATRKLIQSDPDGDARAVAPVLLASLLWYAEHSEGRSVLVNFLASDEGQTLATAVAFDDGYRALLVDAYRQRRSPISDPESKVRPTADETPMVQPLVGPERPDRHTSLGPEGHGHDLL